MLRLPRPKTASFVTTGTIPIPDAGTIYPTHGTTAEWGTLEADAVLMTADRTAIVLPAPVSSEGPVVAGDGWTLTLAPGWAVASGSRAGDLVVVRR